jgi:hypothetical protein
MKSNNWIKFREKYEPPVKLYYRFPFIRIAYEKFISWLAIKLLLLIPKCSCGSTHIDYFDKRYKKLFKDRRISFSPR